MNAKTAAIIDATPSADEMKQWAACRETSMCVAKAIWAEAGNNAAKADRIWDDPTSEEISRVEAAAWLAADPDETTLHWGEESF